MTRQRATRVFSLYCGNPECRTRTEPQPNGSVGRLFEALDTDLVDGEPWLCPACQPERTVKDTAPL